MNCGVVKFNTLTDSDRTGAQNKDFLFVCDNAFVFAVVAGVEVWYIVLLMFYVVNDAVDWHYAVFFSEAINIKFADAPYFCDVAV